MRIGVLLLSVLLLSGCSLERRIQRTQRFIDNHQAVLDKYKVVDTVINTVVNVRIDTIVDTLEIILPAQEDSADIGLRSRYDSSRTKPEYSTPWVMYADTIRAKAGHCEAIAWVDDYRVHLKIRQPETVLKESYNAIKAERDSLVTVIINDVLNIPAEKIIPKWVWMVVGVAIIFFALSILLILRITKKI